MKKRNIIVCSILIIIVVSILTIIINSESKKTFTQDGVTYALNVDGTPSTSFPVKGMYRVDVTCENGTGKWDYDNWKLYIENITGKVSCDMEFTTVSKEYFNDYIIGLSGTSQGKGEVVHEIANDPDYTDATTLTQAQYGSYTTYSASSETSTSGTTVSNVFTFSKTYWSTKTSAMTSGKYYHFQFTVPEDGYYNFCYTLSSGNYNNRLYLFVNNSPIIDWISASSSQQKSSCYSNYYSSGSIIRVVQRAYTTLATISFDFQKANTVNRLDAGYRYEGQNPNNYVWFNNELWRIIGVFDSASHGVSDTNLVKIIRANPIGGLAWDKSDANDWTAASLMNLLNGAYYNGQDGTNGDYCYGYSTTGKAKCDYTNVGISSTYRSMIKNVTWYLGGWSTNIVTTETLYGYERGTTVYSGNATSTTGNIGLMYASDYGYAALASSCARTKNLVSYNECIVNNWLYGIGQEWTITPSSSVSTYVFFVVSSGSMDSYYHSTLGNSARPVLYLDSSVYVIDGSGTESDPYIIGM